MCLNLNKTVGAHGTHEDPIDEDVIVDGLPLALSGLHHTRILFARGLLHNIGFHALDNILEGLELGVDSQFVKELLGRPVSQTLGIRRKLDLLHGFRPAQNEIHLLVGHGIRIDQGRAIGHGPPLVVKLHLLVELHLRDGLPTVLTHEAPVELAAAESEENLLVDHVLFSRMQIFLNL